MRCVEAVNLGNPKQETLEILGEDAAERGWNGLRSGYNDRVENRNNSCQIVFSKSTDFLACKGKVVPLDCPREMWIGQEK